MLLVLIHYGETNLVFLAVKIQYLVVVGYCILNSQWQRITDTLELHTERRYIFQSRPQRFDAPNHVRCTSVCKSNAICKILATSFYFFVNQIEYFFPLQPLAPEWNL